MSASHDTKATVPQAITIPFGNLEPGEVIGEAHPISENYLAVETQLEHKPEIIRFHFFDLANQRKNCCYQINLAKSRDESKEFLLTTQGLPNDAFMIIGSKGHLAIIKNLAPKSETTIIDINDEKAENDVIKGSLPNLPTSEKREATQLKQAFSPTRNEITFIVTSTTEKSLLSIDFSTGKQSRFTKLLDLTKNLTIVDFSFDNEGRKAILVGKKATNMVAEIHAFDKESNHLSLEKTQLMPFSTGLRTEIISVFYPWIIISNGNNLDIIDLERQNAFYTNNICGGKLLGWLIDGKIILGAPYTLKAAILLNPDNHQLTKLNSVFTNSSLSSENHVLLNNGFAVKLAQFPQKNDAKQEYVLCLEINTATDCYFEKKIERCIHNTLSKAIPILPVRDMVIPYTKGRDLFFAAEQKILNSRFLPSYHLSENLQAEIKYIYFPGYQKLRRDALEELTALINQDPTNIASACQTIRKKYPAEFKVSMATLHGVATAEGGPLHELFKKILAECRTAKTQPLSGCRPKNGQ